MYIMPQSKKYRIIKRNNRKNKRSFRRAQLRRRLRLKTLKGRRSGGAKTASKKRRRDARKRKTRRRQRKKKNIGAAASKIQSNWRLRRDRRRETGDGKKSAHMKKLEEKKKQAVVAQQEKIHKNEQQEKAAAKAEKLSATKHRAATKIQALVRAQATRKNSRVTPRHIKSVKDKVKHSGAIRDTAAKWKKKAALTKNASKHTATAIVLYNKATKKAHKIAVGDKPGTLSAEKDAAAAKGAVIVAKKQEKAAEQAAAKAEAAHDKAKGKNKAPKKYSFDAAYEKCATAAKKVSNAKCGNELKKDYHKMSLACHEDKHSYRGLNKEQLKKINNQFLAAKGCQTEKKKCCDMNPGEAGLGACKANADKNCKPKKLTPKTAPKKSKSPGTSPASAAPAPPRGLICPKGTTPADAIKLKCRLPSSFKKGCDPERVRAALCPDYKAIHHIEEKDCKGKSKELAELEKIYKEKIDKCRHERALAEINVLVLQKGKRYVPFETFKVSQDTIMLLTHKKHVIETIHRHKLPSIDFDTKGHVSIKLKTPAPLTGAKQVPFTPAPHMGSTSPASASPKVSSSSKKPTSKDAKNLKSSTLKSKKKGKNKTKKKKSSKKTRRRKKIPRGRRAARAASHAIPAVQRHGRPITRKKKSRSGGGRHSRRRRRQHGGGGDIVIKYKPVVKHKIIQFKKDLQKHSWPHIIDSDPHIDDPGAEPSPSTLAPADGKVVGDPPHPKTPDDLGDVLTPTGDTPAAAAGDTPGGDTPAAEADTPGGDTPAAAAGDTPGGDTPAAAAGDTPPPGGGSGVAGEESLLPGSASKPHKRSSLNCVPEKDRTMIVKIVMPTEGGVELGSGGVTATRMREHVHDAMQTTTPKKKKVVAKGIPVVKGTPVKGTPVSS